MVHVGEAHRAYHLGHPFGAGPAVGGTEEGVDHLVVVNKVNKPEAGILAVCALVDHLVDDHGNAAGRPAVAQSHESGALAVVEGRILPGHKCLYLVRYERRHIVRRIFVKVNAELHEFLQVVFLGADFNYFY